MYNAVISVVNGNSNLWSGLPAFTNVFGLLNQKVTALQQAAYGQSLALVGVSAVKNAKKEIISGKTMVIVSSIAAYAAVNKDVELFNKMKISKSQLETAAIAELKQKIDLVLNKANELVNDLGDYGVNQGMIDELQTLRDELDTLLVSPRKAIVERKVLTRKTALLIKEIDLMLKLQLDKLMVVLKEANPDFFAAYVGARVIIDLKATNNNQDAPEEPDDGIVDPPTDSDPLM